MVKDYHLHANILNEPEKYSGFIDAAIKNGVEEICFTDHMPFSLSDAPDRIPHGRVRDYCRRIGEIKEQYNGIISVKCGIEIDFHPSVSDEIKSVLDAGDFDFILGSTHMHTFVPDHSKHTFNELAAMAIENSCLSVESGLFDAVSHFDMYRFVFENPQRFPFIDDGYDVLKFEKEIKLFLKSLAEKNMLLEINPHLAETKKDFSFIYPQEMIVKWALDAGCRFSYGSDAHHCADVGAMLGDIRKHKIYGAALETWETNF